MKTNIIKCSPSHFLCSHLITEHNRTTISEVPETKFLGVQIDNHLNWKCHIDRILTGMYRHLKTKVSYFINVLKTCACVCECV